MVRALQPYIVTSWHGHRDDPDLPEAIRTVWQQKFRAGYKPRPGQQQKTFEPRSPQEHRQRQSNVDIAILDSEGNLVHWFDGFQHPGRGPQTLAAYTAREIQLATKQLNLTNRRRRVRQVVLPDLAGAPAVRILCTLEDNRMLAYSAPTVEAVPITGGQRELLAWSSEARTLDAADLSGWLSQVYPPGVMERTNPQTKEAYRIASVEGTLTLTPAGRRGKHRLMVLTGTITLTDEGDDHFSYTGKLALLLAYPQGTNNFSALRGTFEGTYPRFDRMHNRQRNIPLRAALESIDTDS
ncbi:MAG: hypothetical protein MK171_05760 [Pirellulales bacterium]|nr:hypothetical protein [Pirellulales bacterium]